MFEGERKKENITSMAIIAILGAMLVFVPTGLTTTTTTHQAFASGATGTLDPNGLLRLDPLAGYTYDIGTEYYIQSATKNFGTASLPDSMRIDFNGKETDSLIIAGYVNVVKGAGNNPNICDEQPAEEISTKINGGVHTNNNNDTISSDTDITPWPNPNSADTMDVGIINFAGDQGRIRSEKTHPSPLPDVVMESGNTYPGVDMCNASPDDWIGFMTIKVNRDTNCAGVGKYDDVWIASFIDTSGLGADGKPQNHWTPTQGGYRTVLAHFGPTDPDMPLKAIWQYWGQYASVNHPESSQQTLRIDHQSKTAWENESDLPYKFITLKKITNIHNEDCPNLDGQNPGARYPGTDDPDSLAATTAATTPLTTTTAAEEEEGGGEGTEDNEDTATATTNNNDNNDNNADETESEDEDTGEEEESSNDSSNNNNDEEEGGEDEPIRQLENSKSN